MNLKRFLVKFYRYNNRFLYPLYIEVILGTVIHRVISNTTSCRYMIEVKIVKESLRRGQNISYFPAFSLYHHFFTQMNGLYLPRHQPTNLLGFWLNIIIFKCKNWYIWMNRNITMLLLFDLMVRINSVNL